MCSIAMGIFFAIPLDMEQACRLRRFDGQRTQVHLANDGVDFGAEAGGQEIEDRVGGRGFRLRRMVHGHLQAVKKDGSAAGADAAIGQRIQDLMESLDDSVAIESGWELDA